MKKIRQDFPLLPIEAGDNLASAAPDASIVVLPQRMVVSDARVRALIAQKADVNAAQADGATAMQWAAYRGDLELADLLIAAGADVKKANRGYES